MKILGFMMLVAGMTGALMAQAAGDGSAQVPEISGGSVTSALCLLSGAIVLIRSRVRK